MRERFLGIMDQVREFSLEFTEQTLGFSLVSPVCVDAVQRPELCVGVLPGDSISKINGVPVSSVSFNAIVNRLKFLPRPMVVHFVRVLSDKVEGPSAEGSNGEKQDPTEDMPANCRLSLRRLNLGMGRFVGEMDCNLGMGRLIGEMDCKFVRTG